MVLYWTFPLPSSVCLAFTCFNQCFPYYINGRRPLEQFPRLVGGGIPPRSVKGVLVEMPGQQSALFLAGFDDVFNLIFRPIGVAAAQALDGLIGPPPAFVKVLFIVAVGAAPVVNISQENGRINAVFFCDQRGKWCSKMLITAFLSSLNFLECANLSFDPVDQAEQLAGYPAGPDHKQCEYPSGHGKTPLFPSRLGLAFSREFAIIILLEVLGASPGRDRLEGATSGRSFLRVSWQTKSSFFHHSTIFAVCFLELGLVRESGWISPFTMCYALLNDAKRY